MQMLVGVVVALGFIGYGVKIIAAGFRSEKDPDGQSPTAAAIMGCIMIAVGLAILISLQTL